MQSRAQCWVGAFFFAVAPLVLTWPLVLHLGTAVHDLGDPLLNIWILGGNIERASSGQIRNFFDANIFFPHPRTLAFSEILIPQTAIAVLPYLLTGNLVLAYNVILLVSMFLTGFGMFLLVRRLLDAFPAALLAGTIFAFSPFMFDHLSHLQISFAGGIPLTLLFLIRFLDRERWRDLLLCAVFFSMQLLANTYYAVFLTYLFAGAVLYHLLATRRLPGRALVVKGLIFTLVVGVLCGPFFWQYIESRQETGFKRFPEFEARAWHYLEVPENNLLYGREAGGEDASERRLFPGWIPILLTLLAWGAMIREERGKDRELGSESPARRRLRKLLLVSLAGCLLAIFGIAVSEQALASRGLFHLAPPFFVLCGLLVLGTLVDRRVRSMVFQPLTDAGGWLRFLSFVLLFAVLTSFGSAGLYRYLHHGVPGFDALRAVPRIHILTLLCLSILAASGLRWLLLRAPRRRTLIASLALILLVAEYVSVPLAYEEVPPAEDLPAVYRWLAARETETPILELPMVFGYLVPCRRVYHAAFHHQPTLDGYSGYLPPFYRELRRRWHELLPPQVLDDARALGARLVIVHRHQLTKRERRALERTADAFGERARLVERFGNAEVWELLPAPADPRPARPDLGRPIPRASWTVSGSPQHVPRLMLDGDPATYWTSGAAQSGGESLTVDLGRELRLSGLSLAVGSDALDYPRGYRVEVSADGAAWQIVAEEEKVLLPIEAFLRPLDLKLNIPLSPTPARFVRIVQTGRDRESFWSVSELEVFREESSTTRDLVDRRP